MTTRRKLGWYSEFSVLSHAIYHAPEQNRFVRILPAQQRHVRSLYSLLSRIEYANAVPFNLFEEIQRTSYHYEIAQLIPPPDAAPPARAPTRLLKGIGRALRAALFDSQELRPGTEYIAAAGIQLCPDATAKIHCIGIVKTHQRARLGTLLMLRLLDVAERGGATRVTLELHTDNEVAMQFYAKFGFQKTGVTKDYYADDEDAVTMELADLNAPAAKSARAALKAAADAKWQPADHAF